jgi:Arc/MetJ family transcription regulator
MKPDDENVDTNLVIHYSSVMKNVTITLDENVARWARIRAAELNTSVSRLVGEMLREKMLDDERYDQAKREYLSQKPQKLRRPGAKYPKREELYG